MLPRLAVSGGDPPAVASPSIATLPGPAGFSPKET